MAESFSTPVLCRALIGCSSERDMLSQLIESARNGQGQVALVSGEAGIGKSRLVAEAKTQADGDFLILQGNCFQVDSSYPYAPLLDLLRAFAAQSPLDITDYSIVREFARLLPE